MKKAAKVVLSLLLISIVAVCFCACDFNLEETKKYTVTVENGIGGGIYEAGSDVTVTAETKDGKIFSAWKEGDVEISTENPYTFKAEKSITLTATYVDLAKYKVTVENGTGDGEYIAGSTVNVKADTLEGKRFTGWKVGEETVSTSEEYSFVVNADTTITATYVNVYTLTVEGGTGAGTYDEGSTVTVTATVGEGKRFVAWKSGVVTLSEEASYTFEINKNMSLTAVSVNVYTVAVEGGTGAGTYDEGESVTITATVEEGKSFVKWTDEDGVTVSTDKVYVFTANANVKYVAVVENIETIEFAVTKNEQFETGSDKLAYDGENFLVSDGNLLVATLPGAYNDVEVNFTLYGADNYGNPSGNFRMWVGDGYCYYYRVYYKFLTLLGSAENENEPTVSITQDYGEKIKYRLTYSDGLLSLYYARFVEGAFEEETLLRTVVYTEENVKIKLSSYASCVRISDFTVKYRKPQSQVKNYTVTVENGEGGGTYKEGTVLSLTATDQQDKKFIKWVDGENNTVSTDKTFSHIVTADASFTAVYENMVQLIKTYTTLEDLNTTNSAVTVPSEGVYEFARKGEPAIITLPDTYDDFEMTFDMFDMGDYGNPSGNFRVWIGDDYCFYFRAYYHFLALLGKNEDENNPTGLFHQQNDEKFRYRIVYRDAKLSLYYAKYTGDVLGEETLARTVDYAKQERVIKLSCYEAVAKLENLIITYAKPESQVKTYTITVEGGEGSGEYREDQKVTVTLTGTAENFIKWVDGQGNELSTKKTFAFYPKNNITVKAVFGESVEAIKKYGTLEDLNTTNSCISVESENVYLISCSDLQTIKLPETYNDFEMTFDMFNMGDYGNASGNIRIWIGDDYCFYFRAYYHFLALLGKNEDENNPTGLFHQQNNEKFRYRIVYRDEKLSLYYAKYTGDVLGEETLARTVDYAKQEREITISCYAAAARIANLTVKYKTATAEA